MKKLLIGFLVVVMTLTVGCVQSHSPPTAAPEPATPNVPYTPEPTTPVTQEVPEEPEKPEPSVVLPGAPPENVTWISPGKVMVGNFRPGARAEWDLLIHNGNDTMTTFDVVYRHPDHVGEGYVMPTEEVQDWVIVADATPILMPKETRNILIVLAMPEDATSPGPNWEFWVSVKDATQTGMVQTELCSRWLVTMRN